jgi:Protein of unknown function (DUF996)
VGSVLRFVGLNALSLGPNFNPSTVPTGDWLALIGSVLISAVYVRKTYGSIASKLKVHMFETAGLVYLIGAATTIILVGFVLLLVAQILVILAFFAIEEKQPILTSQPHQATPVNR